GRRRRLLSTGPVSDPHRRSAQGPEPARGGAAAPAAVARGPAGAGKGEQHRARAEWVTSMAEWVSRVVEYAIRVMGYALPVARPPARARKGGGVLAQSEIDRIGRRRRNVRGIRSGTRAGPPAGKRENHANTK